MDYASLVSLSQTIHKLLCDQDQYRLSPHENQQIESIHGHVVLFQSFLEDYSDKASSLEGRIRDAANEAEDIIEYFMWKQIDQWQNHTSESITEPGSSEVSDLCGKCFDFIRCFTAKPERTSEVSDLCGVRFDFRNLKKVAEEIESIAAVVMEIKNSATAKEVQQLTDSSSVASSSSRLIIASKSGKSDPEMVGFHDQLMAIRDRLHAHFMDDEESWNLLRKKVFQGGNCPPELENIGKTIARSCGGLPLAIPVIAGLLSTVSQTPASWKNIERNVIEAVTMNDEQSAEIVLSLSYKHLPQYLRPCFLYMGIFPEDYEIRVSELIRLWVAEGFLKLPNGSKCCEEVAEEYLENLVKRSLILVTKRKYNGKIKRCSLHNLVRDLCIKKARQEKFFVRVEHREALLVSMINQRRVSFALSADPRKIEGIYGSHIRTIMSTKKASLEHIGDILRCTRLLRVLDVREGYGYFAVNKLFHLRYLCLPRIPAFISNLENLQTLIIYSMSSFVKFSMVPLAFEVWRMPQLKHLVSSCCYFDGFPHPRATRFPLENLQTLSQVKNFKCTKEVLRMIPKLKKLGIYYPEDVNVGDYQLQNLQNLHQLEKLSLEFGWSTIVNFERVKLPTTLKKLTLIGGNLPWKDLSILVGSLPKLEVLKLSNYACAGGKWETSEGEFPQLKCLEFYHILDFEEWITESSHFPSLKWLVLHYCPRLIQIPDDIGKISTLELIEVGNARESLLDSAKRIQEDQREILGNDSLRVHVI